MSETKFSTIISLLDYEDRLVGITYPNTSTNSFTYNAFGARVSKTDSSGTSTYARNGVSVVAPVLSDGSLTFTPGISSRSGSDSSFSHGDIKNSLRQTAESETTSATKHYDAFGNETTSTGTWEGPFQYGGPFGYQTDPDSNLELLGHRYYDSSTGKFLTRDPIKDGRNWYAYAGSNPVLFADPDGKVMMTVVIAAALAPRVHGDRFPAKPSDVRVGINVAETWRRRRMAEAPSIGSRGQQIMRRANLLWFYEKVKTGGDWDFKKLDRIYEDFGNFHYGLIGAALGIELNILLWVAGAEHWWNNPETRDIYGNPLTGPAHGDDPKDQQQIIAGYHYYHKRYEPFRY